jgi:hypothetical protein
MNEFYVTLNQYTTTPILHKAQIRIYQITFFSKSQNGYSKETGTQKPDLVNSIFVNGIIFSINEMLEKIYSASVSQL